MSPDSHASFWEFSSRAITPTVERLIAEPAAAHAVELGYTDGRYLCPAASFFGRVTAIALDETDDEAAAKRLVMGRGKDEVNFVSDGSANSLQLDSNSADFIYSLRGIERLADLDAFDSVAVEAARVLKPGGVAMFWFGRMSRLPFMLPGTDWWRGWARRPAPARQGGGRLCLRMYHARRAVLRAGMKAVALSTPLHPDTSWRLFRGGQMSFVTAWKPPN